MNLFDKLPENFFSILSRKYKAVYAYSLMTLFECLKLYKTDIKKVDYINMLKERGDKIMPLFDVKLDKLDDKNEEEETVNAEVDISSINYKVNYIFRKLVNTGWIDVEKDPTTNVDKIFLPSYSIRMIQLIEELSSDTSLYVPIVHQTYSELSLEDEKEDDYMFRSLATARKNADELELNVTLLHHSICVFGHNLTSVFDPNEALRQHFDVFRTQVSDRIYHPMKTFDSLGLYSLPVINILKKWQHDKRIMSKLVLQAKYDPTYSKKKSSEVFDIVNRMIQQTIDIFARLTSSFEDIDKANAKYTQAVQKKVNYLSNSDKSIKGKLDSIILALARGLDSLPSDYHDDYINLSIFQQASNTINIFRQGFVNSDSLTMPFSRKIKEESEPLILEDDMFSDDSLSDYISNEVEKFSQDTIIEFMVKNFKDNKVITTSDIELNTLDDMILLILATVRAQFGDMFYNIERIDETYNHNKFVLPNYRFTRKGK